MKMKTVFGAYRNAGLLDLRGPWVLDQLFVDKEVADAYVEERARAEKNGDDWKVEELTLAKSVEEVREHRLEQLRRSGLAKLTTDEREALGITS